jgi:hypothetical protein
MFGSKTPGGGAQGQRTERDGLGEKKSIKRTS